ncbi:LURP-one-related/scramblase family protein [Streptococcus sp. ZJ93]|uniref:LURP-one-related/scramblase family protein n=1 Tax=Streptococcus handemini TaxID=3161188 RepID=UPI0032F06F32
MKDNRGQLCYQVEGSVFKWFKNFEIHNAGGKVVSTIQRKFSWFNSRYEIENLALEVLGDFWDMKFDLLHNGVTIARIDQEWFRMTSTYQVTVYEDAYADVTIALVIAIDYVKEIQRAAANAAT